MQYFDFSWASSLTAALLFFPLALGLRAKKRGRTWPWAALTFLVVPLYVAFAVFGWEGAWWENLLIVLRNLSLGMLANGLLLLVWRAAPQVMIVPAVLGLTLYCAAFFVTGFISDHVAIEDQADSVELLVELGPDDTIEEVAAILDRHEAVAERAFPMVDLSEHEDLAQFYVVRVCCGRDIALAAHLRADVENVDYLTRNRMMSVWPVEVKELSSIAPSSTPTDDPRVNEQWALQATGGFEALQYLKNRRPARKAKLAIIDTGVDGAHEDLAMNYGSSDNNGHGTHCAGIAAAVADNGLGIASFNLRGEWIDLRSYPALNGLGGGGMNSIAEAIIQAAEDRADVISMSLGAPAFADGDRVLSLAVEYARSLGSIVVAAAGNASQPASNYVPASLPGVICVTAVDAKSQPANFTNTVSGIGMPIAAPGVDVLSLGPASTYKSMSGTSMACPYIAGVLATLRALRPDIGADDAWRILHQTGEEHGDAGRIGRIVRVDRALTAAGGA